MLINKYRELAQGFSNFISKSPLKNPVAPLTKFPKKQQLKTSKNFFCCSSSTVEYLLGLV